MLALSLTHPLTWDTLVVEMWEGIEGTKRKKVSKEWKSWGELCQLQGGSEATDWLRRGKYEIGEDKDGDACYKKVSVSEDTELTRKKGVAYKKTSHGDPSGDQSTVVGKAASANKKKN